MNIYKFLDLFVSFYKYLDFNFFINIYKYLSLYKSSSFKFINKNSSSYFCINIYVFTSL